MNKYEYLDKINRLEQEAFRLDREDWLKNEVFTWQWWILVAMSIIPWLLWIKFAARNKLLETLLFGTIIIILTTLLDVAGMNLKFWRYPVQLIPIVPRALPYDMAMVPVAYMFIHQYFNNSWKKFSIALISMGFVFAFIGEPISIKLELVHYIRWHYIYSFIYYIVAGLLVRLIIVKVRGYKQANV